MGYKLADYFNSENRKQWNVFSKFLRINSGLGKKLDCKKLKQKPAKSKKKKKKEANSKLN